MLLFKILLPYTLSSFTLCNQNFYIGPHNHLPTLFIVCIPILLNKEVAVLIVWLLYL